MAESGLSINKQNKVNKKLNKFKHIIKNETGINCSIIPSKHLVLCNVGLVNGLKEDLVFDYFTKYGEISDIKFIPGKSCCFISYKDLDSSIETFKAYNGNLKIAQDNKPIYLLYAETLPQTNVEDFWGSLPPGLILLENFISTTEEQKLLQLFNVEDCLLLGKMKHRLVKHFGFEFRYDTNNIDKNNPLTETIPSECNFLWDKLSTHYPQFASFCPDQLTINHYTPGQGIPYHVDTHSAFEDPIISLSLCSPIVMEFKNGDQHCSVVLPQRSLLIMSGESRYLWTHGIVPRKFDAIKSESGYKLLERNTRVSFTFRKILKTNQCTCQYKSKCDKSTEIVPLENGIAAELEKLHVHEIYEKISDHFDDTRQKPWPNVTNFLQSFEVGSLLVDVGCGNGKYLASSNDCFQIGCDYSSGLIDICNSRGHEVFIADCLNIPLKDQVADGAISIAVIHHLANEERRLEAIKEIIRILKPGGQCLIYVWAHDQIREQEKSSYIKQNRKNRKSQYAKTNHSHSDKMPVLNGTLQFPVHINRTEFQAQDVLVPWKLKDEKQTTFHRFYHVFQEDELEKLCYKLDNVTIKKSFYDQGNWCIILERN